MLTINLIPTQEKKNLRLEVARRIIILLTEWLIIFLSIASILLLPSYFPLFLEYRELKRQAEIEEEASRQLKISEFKSESRKIQRDIESIKSASARRSKISEIVNSLLKETEGIAISELIIQKQENIIINGQAATRRDLLDFEKKLRNISEIRNISTPLSNIVKETNINFTTQGKLKL